MKVKIKNFIKNNPYLVMALSVSFLGIWKLFINLLNNDFLSCLDFILWIVIFGGIFLIGIIYFAELGIFKDFPLWQKTVATLVVSLVIVILSVSGYANNLYCIKNFQSGSSYGGRDYP